MNNGTMILNEITKILFNKNVIVPAEKYFNNPEVIKCAKSLRDLVKDINKLKSREESAAAILLAQKMLEEESKNSN